MRTIRLQFSMAWLFSLLTILALYGCTERSRPYREEPYAQPAYPSTVNMEFRQSLQETGDTVRHILRKKGFKIQSSEPQYIEGTRSLLGYMPAGSATYGVIQTGSCEIALRPFGSGTQVSAKCPQDVLETFRESGAILLPW
jgi:hypothetical protein